MEIQQKKPGISSRKTNKISKSALVMHRIKGEHEFLPKASPSDPFTWGVRICKICKIEEEPDSYGHTEVFITASGGLPQLSEDWLSVDMSKQPQQNIPDYYVMSTTMAERYKEFFDGKK